MEVPPLSQTSKRPGARDISDLKARLGLKKNNPAGPGAAPVAAPPGAAQPPAPAGIVPPPGANIQGSIPAPPGVTPPPGIAAPVAAPIPDASADPFGAMNAMAQNATVAAQPEIVVVNDGAPVESVAKKNKGATIARTAAMILFPLVAGVMVGKIGSGASQYNQVIADAKPIRDDVKTVRRSLTELSAALEGAKKDGKFVPGDEKLTAALAALEPVPTNDELIYESSLYHLDSTISREIYTFYSDLHVLNVLRKKHIREAKKEAKILADGAANLAGFNGQVGGLLQIPEAEDAQQGKQTSFRVVQLGPPICQGETKPNTAVCGGRPFTGFGYREDQTTGGWKSAPVNAPGSEAVPGKSLVFLDSTSPMLKQLLVGGEATVAEIDYKRRIEEIEAKVLQLNDTGKQIQNVLNDKANEGGKFSFFL